MYNLRIAVPEDFHAILPMAEQFYNSTSFAKALPFDVPSILEFYIHLLKQGFVIVAEVDDVLVGMLGVTVHPFHLNLNHLVATEAMWWVEPDHRRGHLGGLMIDKMEQLGKDAGCTLSVLASLNTSPKGLGEYYESRGYAATESSYIKEL